MSNSAESGAAVSTIRTVGHWQVPALGAGTWALGGPWEFAGVPAGWGEVDDEVSIAAIRAAYEGGVRLFDTADAYGCGHAERVLGKAVASFRDDVVIATKVGLLFNEATRSGNGIDVRPPYLRRACEASLDRLGTDHIDLYQLHPGEVTADQAPAVVEVFDQLAAAGKIRSYGTANEAVDVIDVFAAGTGCVAVQQQLNVFGANEEALARCEAHDLAVLARSPLAMGFLSGKYRSRDQLAPGDVRRETPYWDYFTEAGMPRWQHRLAEVREELCTGGGGSGQGGVRWHMSGHARTGRSRSAESGHPNRPANKQVRSPTGR
jgi:aryl-alcohol dehydrogenase-like predicted oxidoreductase